MVYAEGFLFGHVSSWVVGDGQLSMIDGGLSRAGVECSTEVIANVLVWTRSVRFAHTAHDCRWRDNQTRALSEEGRRSSVDS